MLFHKKSEDDFSGGGGVVRRGQHSKSNLEHQADLIIYLMKDRIHIGKNRYTAETGNISTSRFMDIALQYFAKRVHNDIAEVFQQGLIDEINQAITKILRKNLLTKEIKNDTFCRTRSGDGT